MDAWGEGAQQPPRANAKNDNTASTPVKSLKHCSDLKQRNKSNRHQRHAIKELLMPMSASDCDSI